MFKNVIAYRIGPQWSATLEEMEAALEKARFLPPGATQEKAIGWVPPRGQAHGVLAESVGGQWLLRLMVETKAVPASVVGRKVQERLAHIEQTEGRKPGRKELRELKDEIKLDLLPMAFTKQAMVAVWIDPALRLLVIDAASQSRADEVVSLLVELLPAGFAVALLQTTLSPAVAMAEWLSTQEAPPHFSVDRECELKAPDESKAVVRYSKHPLDIEEVRQHIAGGKQPTKLAMTWDDRVSFLLTEGLQVKKIGFLDVVFEGTSKEDDGFDTDAAIATGELRQMLPDLLEALGGEVVPGG